MKEKGFLHKACLWLFALALGAGLWIPADAVYAETVTAGELTNYEVAATILDDRLSESGQRLNTDQKLYDLYGKFSDREVEEITERISEAEEESGTSIRVIVTEMDMYYEKYFLEECADRLCDNGYASEDLTLMLLNLDPHNRGVCIEGYGLCDERVNDDRTEYMLDDIIGYFSKDDYVYGIKLFAAEAAYYAGSTDYSTYYKDNSFEGKMKRMPWLFLLVIPAVVAVVGTLLMKHSAGGKMTATEKTYMRSSSSGLTAQRDDFIRTSVSKTYSPQSSGGSARSGGGRSSGGGGISRGGRSHSGGSRRF